MRGPERARRCARLLRVPLLRHRQAAAARQLEAPGGGDGILLDDVFSGLYGWASWRRARLLPDLPWTV
jgi:hypothetical protein